MKRAPTPAEDDDAAINAQLLGSLCLVAILLVLLVALVCGLLLTQVTP